MASEEENCSEEEIVGGDEWPDDFFEFKEKPATPKLQTPVFVPQPVADQTILDLPDLCLQMVLEPLNVRDRIRASAVSSAFRKAVATSKCLAGDQLIVTGRYTMALPISFQPPMPLQSRMLPIVPIGGGAYRPHPNQLRFLIGNNGNDRGILSRQIPPERALHSYHVTLPGVIYQHSVTTDKGADIFAKLKAFFSKLHLRELVLVNMALEEELMASLNTFIDSSCTFDRLVVRMKSTRFMTDKTRALIMRACKDVVFELEDFVISSELLGLLDRHVTFKGNWGWDRGISLFTDEETFMVLVREGHSLEQKSVPLERTKCLDEVIETVSASSNHQKIDVSFGNINSLQLVELYFTAVDAKEAYGHVVPNDRWLAAFPSCMDVRTYKHRRATIYLAFVRGEPVFARLTVTSKDHEK